MVQSIFHFHLPDASTSFLLRASRDMEAVMQLRQFYSARCHDIYVSNFDTTSNFF